MATWDGKQVATLHPRAIATTLDVMAMESKATVDEYIHQLLCNNIEWCGGVRCRLLPCACGESNMTVLLKNLFTVHFQFDLLKLETNNTRDDEQNHAWIIAR